MQKLDLTSGRVPIDRQMESFLADRVRELAVERLSHREVVDKLEEEGVERQAAVRVVRLMASQREAEAQSRFTAPAIFLAVSVAVLIWLGWFAPSENVSHQFTMLKNILFSMAFLATPSLAFVVLYQNYERIPLLSAVFERIFAKRRSAQLDVIEVDERFIDGQLSDRDYETALIQLMGERRGRLHFRYMRNEKHFGLE